MIVRVSLCCVLISAALALPQQFNSNRQQAPPRQFQPPTQPRQQFNSQPQPFQAQPQQQQTRQQYTQPPQQQSNPPQQFNQQSSSRPTAPPVPIISLDNNINFDGSYKYSYEGGDGSRQEQFGQLKTIGQDTGEISQGSYSYVGDDGKTYSVQYTADETGYHPVGDHLPQPPPIPDAILKSLEYLATAPPFKDDQATK